MLPLEGIRVLDFSRVLAGPFCTMALADLGADVVKVESVDLGDETRAWGPPFVGGESAYYLCVNRNKRAIAIDLKTFDGRQIMKRLLAWCDVLVHNFRPGSLKGLNLEYDDVRSINPGIIYCGISAFGNADQRPGYDYLMQAIGGLMSITGEVTGEPMKVGVASTDLFTGLYAGMAIQAALRYRDLTGEGQCIDMALYDAQIAMLANVASNVLVGGQDASRFGNGHPNIVPYQLFHAKDGDVVIAVGNDRQFKAFCEGIGCPGLAEDERYVSNEYRVLHREELIQMLEPLITNFSRDGLVERLESLGVPCGPVRSVKEALSHPDTARRNMTWHVTHPHIGSLELVGSPLKLQGLPTTARYAPPIHGEHTRDILLEFGFSSEEILQMEERGVIRTC